MSEPTAEQQRRTVDCQDCVRLIILSKSLEPLAKVEGLVKFKFLALLILSWTLLVACVETRPPNQYQPLVATAGHAIAPQNIFLPTLGTPPYVFNAASRKPLPVGLRVDLGTGEITGTPLVAAPSEEYPIDIRDAKGEAFLYTITITVNPTLAFTSAYAPGLTATAERNVTPQTPVVTGGTGTRRFSVSPALPAGLNLSAETGALTGAATEPMKPRAFTIIVTDEVSATVSVSLNLTVNPKPNLSYPEVRASARAVLTPVTPLIAGGTAPLRFAISPNLPNGLAFDPASGAMSGTPVADQPATAYRVTVTDANGSSLDAALTIIIEPYQPLRFQTAYNDLAATLGATLSTQTPLVLGGLGARGFSVQPPLPGGLNLDPSSGSLSGMPLETSPAITYTVTVQDSTGSSLSVSFTVSVAPAPNFVSGYSAVVATVGAAIPAQSPIIAGGVGTKRFTITPALPDGLALLANGGLLYGTPLQASGRQTYTVTATDANGAKTTDSFSLTVNPVPVFTAGYSSVSATAGVGLIQQTPTVDGGTGPRTFSISPALPGGLSLQASSGRLTGTPSAPAAAQTYTVTATDANGSSASAGFNLAVNAAPQLSGYSDLNLSVGAPLIPQSPLVTGGTAPFSYLIAFGTLPPGLTLSSADGQLSGTSSGAVALNAVTIRVTDANGVSAEQTIQAGAYQITGFNSLTATGVANASFGLSNPVLTLEVGQETTLDVVLAGAGTLSHEVGCSLNPAPPNDPSYPRAEVVSSSATSNGGSCQLRGLQISIAPGSPPYPVRLTVTSLSNPSVSLTVDVIVQ